MHASHNHSAPSLSRGSTVGGLPRHPRLRRATPQLLGDQLAGAVYAASRTTRAGARSARPSATRPGLRGNRVQRERPVDDSVTVIRVDRADGAPLAALVSFAAHPITVGGIERALGHRLHRPAARDGRAGGPGRRSASSCRAAPATSRRSTTGGSATTRRARTATRRATGSAAASRRPRSSCIPAIETTGDARVAAARSCCELRRRRHAYDDGRARARRIAELDDAARPRLARGLGAGACTR